VTPNKAGVILLAASAAAGLVVWATVYYILYTLKYGPNARTPLSAWFHARRESKDIDRELDKILNPKG
jgi:hypothetical protein